MSLTIRSGKITITPDMPNLELWGYGGGKRFCSGICDDLEANILVFQGRHGKTIVFISLDLLFGSDELEEMIKESVRASGLGECEVIVAASHTHFAPCIDSSFPKIGEGSIEYRNWLFSRITIETIRILQEAVQEPFSSKYGSTHCDAAINRRRACLLPMSRPPFLKREILFLPNPKGEKDRNLQMLVLTNSSGKHTVIWNFGCHPVCHPEPDKISADFPGAVREHIRRQLGRDTVVLFLQGFAANVRPRITSTKPGSTKEAVLAALLRTSFFKKPTAGEYQNWIGSIIPVVDECLSSLASIPFGDIDECSVSIPKDRLVDGYNGPRKDVKLRGIRMGDSLILICASAEVVAEYAPLVKSILRQDRVMTASCVGSNFGYLPTERILREGGYEGGQFLQSFGLTGNFKPGCEKEFSSAILAIKDKLSPKDGF